MSEQRMISDLQKSGLVPDDMNAVLEANDPMQGRPLGYRIPYYFPDGTPHPGMWQTKLFEAKEDGQKYTQPSGITYSYFSPQVDWEKHNRDTTKFIVEGAKKAAAAIKHLDIAAVGINGCWNWKGSPTKKLLRPLAPELAAYINKGDLVYVVLDGDAAYNTDVEHATADFRLAIIRHGATPVIVKLPDEGDHKVGLDDWIVANNATNAAFMGLPVSMSGLEYRESMNSLAYRAHLTCYPTGAPHTTNNNAALAAVATDCFKGILRYDLHRQQWLYNNEPMQDYHLTLINMELARRFLPTIGASAAIAVLEKLQTRDGYCFHPIRDYLNKLKWDGEKRLELMFIKIFGAEDNVYIRAAGRNFLTSAVARAMRPGCKVDTMLILEGAQGIGKTKALALMGLGSHIETTASMDSKDFIGQLQSAWFVDIAELDALRKAEIARVKGLLSMTEDIYRPPYGRLPVRRLRECVFVGSTNSDKYLVDDSGGRRFWPIACGDKIDIDLLTACLDQLYAEAVHRFKSGENWYEMPEQETEEAQNDRSTTEALPWFDFVQGYVSIPANMRKITWCGQPGVGVKIGEILHALEIPLERQTPGHLRDVARILRHLGYKGVQLRAVNMADGGADMKNFKTRYYIRMNWEHT